MYQICRCAHTEPDNAGDWWGTDLSSADLPYANWGPILTDCHTRLPPELAPETLPLLPQQGMDCPGTAPATAAHKGQGRSLPRSVPPR